MIYSEEKPVNYPESITIGGITYSVKENPAILQFMQDVAKVEKNKLYSKFETLNGELNKLKNTVVQPSGSSIEEVVDSLKRDFVTKDDLTSNLRSIVQEVVQPIVSQNESVRLEELNLYREKLIADNEAICMPELVKGNTKEELMKSLQESIELRRKYPTPFNEPPKHAVDPLLAAQASQSAPAQDVYAQQAQRPVTIEQQNPLPQIPEVPRREAGDYRDAPNYQQMSEEQFKNSYKTLEQELRTLYGGQL